jgi:plastocyanin
MVVAGAAACSGGERSASPGPSEIPPATITITITAAGASPRTVTVAPGSRVTFVNNDAREHQMYSDPHPEHTSCPEFDQVGLLMPGQSRTTGNLNAARTCNFHDHANFENVSLRGSVVIR